jgi:glycosyltransferase involved in cell wall biosynthesis
MRIAMISKACLVGAYQRKLEELAGFPGVDLMVIVPPLWKEGSRVVHLERAHTEGYDLVVEPVAFNGSFHLHVYPHLRRRLREFQPDVVHIDEEPYNLATFHALWLSKGLGAAALWFSWQNLNRRYPLPFSLIERYNLRHADYAIVGSEGAARVWREKGYADRLAVIPQFGVDPDLYAPGPPAGSRERSASAWHTSVTRRDPAQGFAIGYVGRLVPEKGVDLLLHAVRDLPGLWRLHIVGEGPERAALERLVLRLGLESRVTFEEGWLPSLRMPAFYRQLDALVLPSRTRPNWIEQFGRVLIEAMASGIPVVGSDCGEIPHVIGHAGLVFPEDDAPALRAHLQRLMHDPDLWSSLSRRGRERVLAHFTQRAIAAQTIAVYKEMLGT